MLLILLKLFANLFAIFIYTGKIFIAARWSQRYLHDVKSRRTDHDFLVFTSDHRVGPCLFSFQINRRRAFLE
jgi:hypothetical protein